MPKFFFALDEEYFALVVADPGKAPDEMYFAFYDEGISSPLISIDWRDLDVWIPGDFLPLNIAFPNVTLEALINEWEVENGERWDNTKVFRAFRVRVEVFISQEHDEDFTPKEIADSLEVNYSFGAVEQLRLDTSSRCYGGSIEELEDCQEKATTH